MKPITFLLSIFLLASTGVSAQKRQSWLVRSVNKLGALIDTMAIKGVDHRYIQAPDRPWQLMLKTNVNDMDLKSTATLTQSNLAEIKAGDDFNIETTIDPRTSTSIGAWIGYRGYGLGLSYSLAGNNGRNFSIGATGSNYGVNLHMRKYDTREMSAYMWAHEDGEFLDEDELSLELYDDVNVSSTLLDGYYLLNGKRFSYAAAYDQSVIQIRSAGSLIIGAMWYQTSIDYAKRLNGLFIQLFNNVGKIKIQEGSIGVGYAYNWVPVKNLLINVMVIPMLTLYNRNKAVLYDCNYNFFIDSDTGGQKAVPDDGSWTEDITLTEREEVVKYGKVSLNFDARMSITYHWNHYFFNIYGQWNRFRNSIESNTLHLNTWYVNASLGVRL